MDEPIRNKEPRKGQNGRALHYISWKMLGIKCHMQSLSWKWSNKPLVWPFRLNNSLVTFSNALLPGFKLRDNTVYLVGYLNNTIYLKNRGKMRKWGNKKKIPIRYLLLKFCLLKYISYKYKPDKSSIHTGCSIVLLRCFLLWLLSGLSPPRSSNSFKVFVTVWADSLINGTKETPTERKKIGSFF